MRESTPLPDGRGTLFSTVRANINLTINKPDTLVRSGQDGKWIPADRWKGLLPPEEEQSPPQSTPPKPTPMSAATEIVSEEESAPKNEEDDPLYHMQGQAVASAEPIPFSHSDDYDFFQFVGFQQSISQPLYDALVSYSQQHKLTVT